jgi:hypothetical protein
MLIGGIENVLYIDSAYSDILFLDFIKSFPL